MNEWMNTKSVKYYNSGKINYIIFVSWADIKTTSNIIGFKGQIFCFYSLS